ncbi:MAG TPA: FAD binding domain-containing protein [Phototrophicaceae bacterium]|nr:FAD binding domain-containing protein [Phototrophicaceae bacterium]
MKLWHHYHTPTTVVETITLLAQYAGQARIIGGGTDLLVEMRADGGCHPQEALVDITGIPELTQIETDGEFITIGAGVTHTQIVQSPLLTQAATCLVESCGVVGGPQVRNVGTLGGNVVNALPAGDGTTSLVALDTEAEIIQNGERRWTSIQSLFLGPGQSLLDPTRDLLLRFRFRPAAAGEATAFKRIMRPQGVALPILGCAVWVQLDETCTTFAAARIALAPIGPTPARAVAVENALIGQPATETTIQHIAELAQTTLHPRTSKYRATATYRQEMIGVLLRRTLPLAVQRAQTGTVVPEGVGA